MTLLVVFALLCLGLVTSQPVSIQIADRAIGGFHATKIAVNPFSPNNTFVVDQYRWVRPVGVNATLSPTDKTAFFNVSVGWKIEGLVVGNDVFWITQSSDWGRKCIALVDSNTKQTINNQTIQNLNYPFVDLPLIASPTSNSNFMKDKVTMFAQGVGADTPYFWSIDKSETVFTWEQLIYFDKTRYTAFCATYDVGVVIQSQGLGATPHLHVSDTAGLGWDGALSSLSISNSWIYDIAAVHTGPTSMVVYMLPMNSTTVLCWNITDYYDGLKPGSQCDSFDIPQHNKADIEILNSTHVIVADISYQGAFMYNIATHSFAGWILPDQPTLNQPSTIRVNDDFIYVSQHPCAVKINATTGGLAFNYSQSLSSMHQLVAGLAVDDDSETVFISYQTDSAYMLDVYDFNDVLLRSMKVSSAGALVYSSVLGVIWVASADAATPSVIALDPLNGGVISFVNFTISNQIIVDFKQITFSSFAVVDSVKKEIIITDSQGVILQQVVLDTLKPSTFDVDLQLDTLYVVVNNQTASQPNSMLVAVDISSSQITKQLQVAEGFHDTYLFQGVAVRASDGDVFATYFGEDVIFQWNSST